MVLKEYPVMQNLMSYLPFQDFNIVLIYTPWNCVEEREKIEESAEFICSRRVLPKQNYTPIDERRLNVSGVKRRGYVCLRKKMLD
jgi:hypothetical protein